MIFPSPPSNVEIIHEKTKVSDVLKAINNVSNSRVVSRI